MRQVISLPMHANLACARRRASFQHWSGACCQAARSALIAASILLAHLLSLFRHHYEKYKAMASDILHSTVLMWPYSRQDFGSTSISRGSSMNKLSLAFACGASLRAAPALAADLGRLPPKRRCAPQWAGSAGPGCRSGRKEMA
jgi:hypothetical protein